MTLNNAIFILLSFFCSTLVRATTSDNLAAKPISFASSPIWVGFKPFSDPAVPLPVEQASRSVYQIIYPEGSELTVDTDNGNSPINLKIDPDWKSFQVANCRNQGLKRCPIFATMGSATAWIVRDSSTIATALHTIHDWVRQARTDNPGVNLFKLVLPIMLLDNTKRNIDPYAIWDAKLSYTSNKNVWDESNTGDAKFRLAEHIEITYAHQYLGKPLTIAKKNDPQGTNYLVGYPNQTNIFTQFGGTDTDGIKLVVSAGSLRRMDGKSQNLNSPVIDFTNAGYFGNSGGPLLNAGGEVIGLATGGVSKVSPQGQLLTGVECLSLGAR